MRSARFHGNSDVRIEDMPEPTIGPGQVGIDVAWCGICATDLREFVDGPLLYPGHEVPNPTTGETLPIAIGHEVSGVVYEIGADVSDIAVGDHVVVEPVLLPHWVKVGPEDQYNTHPEITWNGIGGGSGGLSEKMVVSERWAHKVDKSIPLDAAALMEPLSTAIHAVHLSGAKAGDTALITGAGPVGLLIAKVLSGIGVKTIVSEPIRLRRELAKNDVGVDYVLDPEFVDVAEEVLQITDGKGVDIGFECSANSQAMDSQVDSLRRHGQLMVVAFFKGATEIDLTKLAFRELTIRGTMIYNNDHETSVGMVEDGVVDLSRLVSHRISLDELVSVGYDTLINRNETAMKILVSPSGKGL
jgi:(R,R)-butanediol dehydrogenase / meso-butanediol dehydrogenase / diacetyl reductase